MRNQDGHGVCTLLDAVVGYIEITVLMLHEENAHVLYIISMFILAMYRCIYHL